MAHACHIAIAVSIVGAFLGGQLLSVVATAALMPLLGGHPCAVCSQGLATSPNPSVERVLAHRSVALIGAQ